jgi:hypothetical protein
LSYWGFVEGRRPKSEEVERLSGFHSSKSVTSVSWPHIGVFSLDKVRSTETSITSLIGCAVKKPATLGIISLPKLLLSPTTFL